MPIADTALRVSDWRLAKALRTIACNYLLLRPTLLRSPEVFTKAVDLPTPYEMGGDRWFGLLQPACHNRGTNRRSNALSRWNEADSSNQSGGIPALYSEDLVAIWSRFNVRQNDLFPLQGKNFAGFGAFSRRVRSPNRLPPSPAILPCPTGWRY
jgi:hypothetical protein